MIYIEKQAKDLPQTKKILEKFKNSEIIFIDNYKNIFDKKIAWNKSLRQDFVISKLNSTSILRAPDWYWHNNNQSFF